MNPVPILFLSDSPDTATGLARISRDLAANLVSSPHFRVGFMGANGFGTTKLPFMQYNFSYDRWQWGEQIIQRIWEDFAGDERGVIMTVWDASRLFWFGCPQHIPEGNPNDDAIKEFLTSGKFQKWGYFAIDATGPGDKLTQLSSETLKGYDRCLAYTDFGAGIVNRSTGSMGCEWIPHGYNDHLFQPRDRKAARMAMGFKEKDTVIGCVMSNQPRKDWGLFFGAMAGLKEKHSNLRLWCHVDAIERSHAWSLQALVADYGFGKDVMITTWMTDEELSFHYSGCDLTVLPSLGEGFGYPIIESLACGVPCIHGNYGGGAELVPKDEWLVDPYTFRLETLHNCLRPVYRPEDWIEAVQGVIDDDTEPEFCLAAVDHLRWSNLWITWKKWFEEGISREDNMV